MNYDAFVLQVQQRLLERFPEKHVEIRIVPVTKANDRHKDGIAIREEGRTSAPTVYLDDFYEWYQDGADVETIVDMILKIHEENKDLIKPEVWQLEDFAYAKEHITCKLLNLERNREYLQNVPYLPFLDLAIVFYCTIVEGKEGHVLSSKVTNELMQVWHTDAYALWELARQNTPEILGIELLNAQDLVFENYGLSEETHEELKKVLQEEQRMPIYILSNRVRNGGAVNFLLGNKVRRLARQLHSELYIIPSSIHEVLLLPVTDDLSKETVDAMVREVNQTVLDPQDVLSDHAYIYSPFIDEIWD